MANNADNDPVLSIQNALLRIFKVAVQLPAQAIAYASMLGATAYLVGPVASVLGLPTITVSPDWKPALDLIASTVGANIFSSLLLQLAQGQDVPDGEIRQQLEQAISKSDIAGLLTAREFQRAIARLIRDQNHLRYLILTQEYTLAEKLAEQYAQYEILVEELQGNLVALHSELQLLPTRDEVIPRLDHIVRLLAQQHTGDVIFQIYTQSPEPLSRHIRIHEYESLVNDHTREFVGRGFIFKTIDDLVTDNNFRSGYIVISGEPGIGKTALVAELVKQKGYIHHFNISLQNIRTPRDFLTNVCAQLIVRYGMKYFALPEEVGKDSGFLSQLLTECSRQGQPVVILVDALDEAEDIGFSPAANSLYLPPVLPEGVFIVVTTRERADYHLTVNHRKDIYLRDDDPANLDDVRQYIRNFVDEHRNHFVQQLEQWGTSEDEFVALLTMKSQGNFMYLVYVLKDIRDGTLNPANIDKIHDLPQGLQAYYQRHWRLMRDQDVERFERYYQPVVCILATVREPVSVGQIVEWTKLTLIRVKDVIHEWREFLNEDRTGASEPLYSIYHTSFQDFLREEVGLTYYHNVIAQTALDKIIGWKNGSAL